MFRPNPASGHDSDPASGQPNQLLEQGNTLLGARSLSRRQNPIDAELDEIGECLARLGRLIESAMESDGEMRRGVAKPGRGGSIDAPRSIERPEDDSLRPRLAGQLDIAGHPLDFRFGVTEGSGTGPNHHVKREVTQESNPPKESEPWSCPSQPELTTEFQPASARGNCTSGQGLGFDARFHENRHAGQA